ncbi:MAG: 2-hydroxyacyl-CoA dehydratase family protein, partial [Clostridiales Family XIII bacterium]|nr:2-hydroxyacyl-CoA dehydratase family protein [Clostridiales Family XIII bacterium]
MHDIHYNNIMNNNINALLDDFAETAGAPEKQLRAFLAAGKSVVGLLPYFCPEEIVYAAGMIPFGLWGADRRVSEARRYFPAFICSILQTVLEQGILGELAGLRAVLIPVSCDSLKGLQSNWDSAVKDVPFIAAAQAQNRKTPAGIEFTASQYRKIGDELARLGGEKPADERVREAIRLYNRKRKAQRGFADAAGKRPDLVSPAQRSAVLKSAYYREVLPYTEQVETLTRLLLDAPAESAADGVSGAWVRIVTTGIVCDALPLLRIFGENRIVIAGDQVSQESVS